MGRECFVPRHRHSLFQNHLLVDKNIFPLKQAHPCAYGSGYWICDPDITQIPAQRQNIGDRQCVFAEMRNKNGIYDVVERLYQHGKHDRQG